MADQAGGRGRALPWGMSVRVLALLVLAAYLVLPPRSLQGKANLVGFGICHQYGTRSYFLGGKQLPLCARDTGTYLGALTGAAVILAGKRRRASGLPAAGPLALFMLGFAFFAIDGLNSYADVLPIMPQLYTPDNRLRLVSGLFCGIGLAAVLIPLFNYGVWRDPEPVPIVRWRELAIMLLGTAFAFAAVTAGPAWLYAPLALLNAVGVVLVLSTVNGLLAWLLMRREGQGRGWRDVTLILSLGLLMSAAELGGLGYLRYVLQSAAGFSGV